LSSLPPRLEDLSAIGNCQIAALVRNDGAVVWSCMPRFDSEPVFGELLDKDGGVFFAGSATGAVGTQRYVENTNVLETTFEDADGKFRVIDFAPRFRLFDRMFRPTKIVRILEPISGTPRVRVSCEPRTGWSRVPMRAHPGSNHLSFGPHDQLRLTTDIPVAYVGSGQVFALTQRKHLVLAWGAPVEEPLAALADRFLRETTRYWQTWVKHADIPPLHQREVIRSALALKLHCYEDTGAIVASLTTSIPESPRSGRTWDYRYCWLRDAYYALEAFRLLGHFEEREAFVEFLLNVASSAPDLALAPLYRVDGRLDLEERILGNWSGFGGDGPVREGNGAVHHVQNDVYGEMVLAVAPAFLDERFSPDDKRPALDLLVRLARKAMSVAGKPDASIWELRTKWEPQTFSGLMCWAGVDRVRRVAQRHAPSLVSELGDGAARIHVELMENAWSPELGAFVSSYGGREPDASLLQMATLRFLPLDHPRLIATIDAIQRDLDRGGWLQRYQRDDGFGQPAVAFVICTFWLIEALAIIGRAAQAEELLTRTLSALSPTGLLAEDWDPSTRQLRGNYPQAYSLVGLIHAAFAASPSWSEVL
jgi:GH15 family glucan-1,4-alpha-glucosidase